MILGCTSYPSHPKFKGYLTLLNEIEQAIHEFVFRVPVFQLIFNNKLTPPKVQVYIFVFKAPPFAKAQYVLELFG